MADPEASEAALLRAGFGASDDSEAVAAVDALWQMGRAAWPDVAGNPARFGRWLRTMVDETAERIDLARLQGADIYLADACIGGDPVALRALEQVHLAPVTAALRRAGYEAALVDEAVQLVRYRV